MHITLLHYFHLQTYLKVSVECMSKIKSILSIIFDAIYGALYIQFTDFFYNDCNNTCTLSCYPHQIGSMNELPLFEIIVCAVYISVFLLLAYPEFACDVSRLEFLAIYSTFYRHKNDMFND